MALGDAHVTHDPITGQGANAASRAAFVLGAAVVARAASGGRFDEGFCAETEERLWEATRAAAVWTNAFLDPPPPHVLGLLVAAARNKAIADAFTTNFDDPDRMWQSVASPEATAAFLAGFGAS
jgi:2-polyprenyl-6-methoxyphenol hydroxylase-like FAD-dependent oxidoreductase